jgi:prepilin-type N-terminal cleavage/methylation domain-containing protein
MDRYLHKWRLAKSSRNMRPRGLPPDHRRPILRQGFTLMEIAIALGVMGIILAAIWVAASAAQEKNNINQAVQELQTISQNILSIWQGQTLPGTSTTLLNAQMIGAGAVPSSAVIDASTIANPWGTSGPSVSGVGNVNGGVFIYPVSAKSFRIKFVNIPLDGCIALYTQGTSCQTGQSGCPTKIYTFTTSLTPDPVTGWSILSPAVAQGICTAGGAAVGDGIMAEFEYSL